MLAAGVGVILLGAILFLTLSVLLVVVPIALIAGAVYYLFDGPRRPAPDPTEIIEGEYRVVEPREIEDNQKRRG
jgi:hypothetical protein